MEPEKRIESFLRDRMGWRYPCDIDLDALADELGVYVSRNPYTSACIRLLDGPWVVFLCTCFEDHEQRLMLAHELAHQWLDLGCQWAVNELTRERQEWKAVRLSYHILAPDYMLRERLDWSLYELSEEFRMPVDWVSRRMRVYWAQHQLQGGV